MPRVRACAHAHIPAVNDFGAAGGSALAEALKANKALTLLNIDSTCIGAEGASAVAAALKANSALLSLDIGGARRRGHACMRSVPPYDT
jgi:Leucine Rich repeat